MYCLFLNWAHLFHSNTWVLESHSLAGALSWAIKFRINRSLSWTVLMTVMTDGMVLYCLTTSRLIFTCLRLGYEALGIPGEQDIVDLGGDAGQKMAGGLALLHPSPPSLIFSF